MSEYYTGALRSLFPLPRVEVPSESVYMSSLDCMTHTGDNAPVAVAAMPPGLPVAVDIETPSVTDSFSIKCVTAAWKHAGTTHTVLLDPLRIPAHAEAVRMVTRRARLLVLHKSDFDLPGMYASGLLRLSDLDKVMDTLILARMVYPDTFVKKSLEALGPRLLNVETRSEGMKLAQKASGLTSNDKWFREGDIHIPVYRMGAMADTVVTLRLAEPLWTLAEDRQLDHPFGVFGLNNRAQAAEVVHLPQRVNQIMLRRACRGLVVDFDYMDGFVDNVHADKEKSERFLTDNGIRPGVGPDLCKRLQEEGALPANWPLTATGKFQTTKEVMAARLPDHPYADAHRFVVDTTRILGYMEKTVARSAVTGRLHPQYAILGASTTGRMSISEPELQQFSAGARPIIRADEGSAGLHSIDWSAIEPALLGWMSNDWGFITPYEGGADIYAPLVEAARCERSVSKTILLGDMYGQGRAKTAAKLKMSEDAAAVLKRGIRSAMPVAMRFMGRLKTIAEDTGLGITAAGRVLPIEKFNNEVKAYKAPNAMFQGSGADLLMTAIVEADRAGLADHLMIPMHDELVVNTEAAAEVMRIMTTPPPYLLKWTRGRVPVMRCDGEFTGPWRKV